MRTSSAWHMPYASFKSEAAVKQEELQNDKDETHDDSMEDFILIGFNTAPCGVGRTMPAREE